MRLVDRRSPVPGLELNGGAEVAKSRNLIAVLAVVSAVGFVLVGRETTATVEQPKQRDRIVPLPTADLSNPDRNFYTIYDRAGQEGPVRSWALAISKNVIASISGLGTIRDGVLKPDDKEPSPEKVLFAIVLTFLEPVEQSIIGSEKGPNQIFISNNFGKEPTLFLNQETYQKYCSVEPADFGLVRVVDADPTDRFKQCEFLSGRFLSGTDFKAPDMIQCGPVGGGTCEHSFSYNGWNIGAIYKQANLAQWRDMRHVIIDYLEKATQQ